jgi:hypothetical protein
MKVCPYCGTKIGRTQGLCSTCHIGVVQYPEQNQVIIDAYVAAGLVELGAWLERHADFNDWLIAHHREEKP